MRQKGPTNKKKWEEREAKRLLALAKEDEKNLEAARELQEDRMREMDEWDQIIEEEELGVQVNDILNEGDDLERLMFGCSLCSRGECVWLVHKEATKDVVAGYLPIVIKAGLYDQLNKRRRFAAYRHMARTISDRGNNERVKLPECVVVGIRNLWAEPTGKYATPV